MIETITANSREKDDVYRLLNMVHVMAGRAACIDKREWNLARTCSEESYSLTAWTNGIVDIEARTWKDCEPHYHEYRLIAVQEQPQ
jgi:hypothetical protein